MGQTQEARLVRVVAELTAEAHRVVVEVWVAIGGVGTTVAAEGIEGH